MNAERPFFQRLGEYYGAVGRALAGDADAAGIFPNSSDIGLAREWIYARFLEQHLPSSCNVLLGGFLFSQEGEESAQLDAIVTSDACLQYNLFSDSGRGKSFSCVDGTLAVVNLKSTLDQRQLENALENIATVPRQSNPTFRPNTIVFGYHHWPFKIIYAPAGNSSENILEGLQSFYERNPGIRPARRPDVIHVLGQYVILYQLNRAPGQPISGDASEYVYRSFPDTEAHVGLPLVVTEIQSLLTLSRDIQLQYSAVLGRIAPHLPP